MGKKKEARGGQVARLCSVGVEAVSQSHWAVWRLLKLPYELYLGGRLTVLTPPPPRLGKSDLQDAVSLKPHPLLLAVPLHSRTRITSKRVATPAHRHRVRQVV